MRAGPGYAFVNRWQTHIHAHSHPPHGIQVRFGPLVRALSNPLPVVVLRTDATHARTLWMQDAATTATRLLADTHDAPDLAAKGTPASALAASRRTTTTPWPRWEPSLCSLPRLRARHTRLRALASLVIRWFARPISRLPGSSRPKVPQPEAAGVYEPHYLPYAPANLLPGRVHGMYVGSRRPIHELRGWQRCSAGRRQPPNERSTKDDGIPDERVGHCLSTSMGRSMASRSSLPASANAHRDSLPAPAATRLVLLLAPRAAVLVQAPV